MNVDFSNKLWCGLETDEFRTNGRAADNTRLKEMKKEGFLFRAAL